MIEFNFIYSKDSLSIRRFLKGLDIENYISYQDTFNKLTKNDFYSEEPCDIVVNSFLIKELEKELTSEATKLYYVISNLDADTIDNVKFFVEEFRPMPTYQLFIINEECRPPKRKFHKIHFIENVED